MESIYLLMEDVCKHFSVMETISNYINGELVEPKNLKYSRVFNPSTGKVYAKCPESSTADLKSAISSICIFPAIILFIEPGMSCNNS